MKALLDAIAANPADDAPRRVYADALLENGEPLGEFIHVQLDLAAGGLARDAAIARRKRERELWDEHHPRWFAPLSGLASGIVYRRGFAEEATVHATVVAERWQELVAAAPALRRIVLGGVTGRIHYTSSEPMIDSPDAVLARFAAALASPLMTRLEGLGYAIGYDTERESEFDPYGYVSLGNEAMPILCAAAPRLANLRALAISSGPVADLAASGLLAHVDELDLGGFYAAAARDLLHALEPGQLRTLRYPGTRTDELRRVLDHPAVAAVDDLAVRWIEATDGELAHHPALAHVTRLRFDTHTASAPIRALVNSPMVANVVELDLSPTRFDACYEAMKTASRLDALRVLRIGDGWTSKEAALRILEWPIVARLEVLDLRTAYEATKVREELTARFDGVVLTRAVRA